MPHREEPSTSAASDEETDQPVVIADVSGMTMLELLQCEDAKVVEGARRLVADYLVLPVTSSWSSFLDPGARPVESREDS
ncbi:hypothetical protein AB0M54_42185 [Actinoplanes sp. NPDC051470]|uniref:hypothetical protein n=1 Tax=unclassified Actinoplanes TaxID=2626549 RepID=UPI00342F38FF